MHRTMSALGQALQSTHFVISVIGDHASEDPQTIFERKIDDIKRTGSTYWLVRSPKARPPQVQALCQGTTAYVLFVSPASVGGARPTTTADVVSEISQDRSSWESLPAGKGPVTGKLDAVAAALVFDELECADQYTAIDLREFAEFPRSDRPLRFTLGSSTVCAMRRDMSNHPERMKSHSRVLVAWARLARPYCVWVR
jgi:hypothetical protein